ncbi:hypothetical protein EDB81DRAFT_29399 [Dactylonectria macrodidyma]|uniref:F-box domain-containing protein n=1 Tax=Dactylonectria macrodidyma TaxID=307937 RepID=A0A9P9JMR4_9HYPO|nr:hypothetical protein EDB81DRAFT_29399 [Dactylonectria macrodidyma]
MNNITNHPGGNVDVPTENLQDLSLVNSPRTLDNLPIEMLIRITENLCAHCVDSCVEANMESVETDMESVITHSEARERRQALKGLCLVARKYSAVAQPILHHYYCANIAYSSDANVDRLALLLRTITNRADLANSVQVLLLDPIHERAGSQDSVIQSSQTTAEILDEASRQVKLAPSLERPVALLKTLIVAATSKSLQYLSDAIREGLVPMSLPESITCLPRLQVFNLRIIPSRDRPTYPLLKSFRNLEVLKVSRHFPLDHAEWPAELVTGQARIANLRKLIAESLDLDGLHTVLRSCPQLRDLEIFLVTGEQVRTHRNWARDLTRLYPLLRSLQRLVLSPRSLIGFQFSTPIPQQEGGENEILEQNGPNFTLAGLCKLEVLELSLDLLLWLGTRNLSISVPVLFPPSLRILHLCTSQKWNRISTHLQDFAAAKVAGDLPELVVICVEYTGDSNADFPEALPPEITEQMELAGVKCSLIYNACMDADKLPSIPDTLFIWRLETRFLL